MALVGALLLVKVGRSYWLINVRRRPIDWCRIRVIKVIGKGTLFAEYAHRGAIRFKNETGVSKKEIVIWQNTHYCTRGE
jgi:hypothetical protein